MLFFKRTHDIPMLLLIWHRFGSDVILKALFRDTDKNVLGEGEIDIADLLLSKTWLHVNLTSEGDAGPYQIFEIAFMLFLLLILDDMSFSAHILLLLLND